MGLKASFDWKLTWCNWVTVKKRVPALAAFSFAFMLLRSTKARLIFLFVFRIWFFLFTFSRLALGSGAFGLDAKTFLQ